MGVKRIETIADDEDYVEYIIFHDDGTTGGADLRLTELGRYHHMTHQLRDENIPDGSKVAETFVYPHSETSVQRQGVGSQVLDHIVMDARSRGVRVLYAETTNLAAEGLFRKNGFKGNYSPHCYLVIN